MKRARHAPARLLVLLALTGVRCAAVADGVQKCNPLVELAGSSLQSIQDEGFIRRDHSLFINSGLRFAVNRPSGLQIVPGIGMPIGIGPSRDEYGVFVYFSLEHPAFTSLL